MKIIAPNKNYTGVTAGVKFKKGVGQTSDTYLIDWFLSKGFSVEHEGQQEEIVGLPQSGEQMSSNSIGEALSPVKSKFADMTVEELKVYAETNDINLGKATSQEGILKKILATED